MKGIGPDPVAVLASATDTVHEVKMRVFQQVDVQSIGRLYFGGQPLMASGQTLLAAGVCAGDTLYVRAPGGGEAEADDSGMGGGDPSGGGSAEDADLAAALAASLAEANAASASGAAGAGAGPPSGTASPFNSKPEAGASAGPAKKKERQGFAHSRFVGK
jgi:hypothetical protein